jgi:L-lactate utilization protein LutC
MAFDELASKESVERASAALKQRGISAEFVESGADALRRLRELIPAGAELMTAGSTTLSQIGFTALLKSGRHPWKNLKDAVLAEKDAAKQAELRKRSVTADYFIGSVHAVAETGEVLVASASGSQLPSYAFSSANVIWLVGTQKIVADVQTGMRRLREYCLPLEDARMKSVGYEGSTIGKVLVFEREINPERRIRLVFVNEKLGF